MVKNDIDSVLIMKFSLRLAWIGFLIFFILSIVGNVYFAMIHYRLASTERRLERTKAEIYAIRVKNQTDKPPTTTTKVTWNRNDKLMNLSTNELKYFSVLFGPSSASLYEEQFTVLVMTYKRSNLLEILIPHYCSTGPRLHKILIVWNEIESEIPERLRDINCAVVLQFVVAKANKLTNRFIPYPEIETEGVFCIDDDRKIAHDDLILAFRSWQQIRHKILGFERRTHSIMADGSYVYGEKADTLAQLGYSIVLSTNFILHKAYFEMFQMDEFLPKGIVKYVDEKMNCEDFAMCIMVGDFLERVSSSQSCCFVVRGRSYPDNMEEKNGPNEYQGLSKRGGRHYSERTKCLNDFRPFYKNGKIPLHYTQVKITHESRSYYRRKRH